MYTQYIAVYIYINIYIYKYLGELALPQLLGYKKSFDPTSGYMSRLCPQNISPNFLKPKHSVNGLHTYI